MSKCTDHIVAVATRSRNLRHHLRFPILLLRSWSPRQHSHHISIPNVDYNLRSYTETDVDRLLLEPAKGGKFCNFVKITASHPLVGKGDLMGERSQQDKKFISKKLKLRIRRGVGVEI